MPFNSETASRAGKKSKRGPSKCKAPNINEKLLILQEIVLDDLIENQKELSKTEQVNLFIAISNYISQNINQSFKNLPPSPPNI
jgi:hypothetical protein